MTATAHSDRCVCTACMHREFPQASASVVAALRAERLRSDSVQKLDTYQRRLLATFTKRWNDDRALRGLRPVLAHDALTQGLESLIAMVEEGSKAL